MDKASDYESGDSRFESWQGRTLETHQQVSNMNNLLFSGVSVSKGVRYKIEF